MAKFALALFLFVAPTIYAPQIDCWQVRYVGANWAACQPLKD